MLSKRSVLLIQNDIKTLSELTQECINCGISEKNIFSVTEPESAERYLEIAGISHIIVDAELYNVIVEAAVEKFSEYFPITVIINNADEKTKTLRMLSNKSLLYLNDMSELDSYLRPKTVHMYQYKSQAI